MKTAVILAAVLLYGCTTQRTVYLPDGRQGLSINCSGTMQSWEACYIKASDICGSSGYEIVAQNDDQGVSLGGPIMTRTMLISCNE